MCGCVWNRVGKLLTPRGVAEQGEAFPAEGADWETEVTWHIYGSVFPLPQGLAEPTREYKQAELIML